MKLLYIASTLIILLSAAPLRAIAGSKYSTSDYAPAFYSESLRREKRSVVPDAPESHNYHDFDLTEEGAGGPLPESLLPLNIREESIAARTASDAGSLVEFLSGKVTVERIMGTAVALSPVISRENHNLKGAMERYRQSAFLDRLIYGYTALTGSLNIATGPKNNMRMTTMEYPYPGMASLRGSATAIDVESARIEYEKALRGLFSDIKLAFADVLYFDEAERITRENLTLADDAENAAVTMYETGMAAYSDMVMASIRRDKLKATADSLAREKAAAISKLSELAGIPADSRPTEFLQYPTTSKYSRDDYVRETLSRNSDLALMKQDIRRMDVMVEMITRKLIPDHTLGLSYYSGMNIEAAEMKAAAPAEDSLRRVDGASGGMSMKSSMGGGDASGMNMNKPDMAAGGMGGMGSFPQLPPAATTPNFASENSYAVELKEKRMSMSMSVQDMEKRMTAEVDENYSQYLSASENARIYENSIIKSAKDGYDAALGEYFSGTRDFMNLMDSVEMVFMNRMELAMYKRDMRMTLAMLEKMSGGGTATVVGEDGESK